MLSAHRPALAVILTAGATASAWLLGVTADPFLLTGFAVFRHAERRGVRRFPWWMFAGLLIVLALSLGFGAEGVEDRLRGMLLSAVVLSAARVLGVRTREARREAAARSRADERLRLARDVHDVLSHSLGAIGVRAGVAAHVTSLDADELRGTLREIEGDARSSLSELKLLLQRERAGGDSSFPLNAALAEIIRMAERADVKARLSFEGDVDALPAVVRTTVLRVVQEAVTNVIRHATADGLTVTLRISDDAAEIQVTDDGRGAPNGVRDGHGLIGMRERVELAGGTLRVVSTSEGFTVSASVPLGVPVGAGDAP
jgi:Signal transduction histidine kinase